MYALLLSLGDIIEGSAPSPRTSLPWCPCLIKQRFADMTEHCLLFHLYSEEAILSSPGSILGQLYTDSPSQSPTLSIQVFHEQFPAILTTLPQVRNILFTLLSPLALLLPVFVAENQKWLSAQGYPLERPVVIAADSPRQETLDWRNMGQTLPQSPVHSTQRPPAGSQGHV